MKQGSRSKGSVVSSARARAWQSMRVLMRFTLPQIEATADIKRSNAKRYVLALRVGGYVVVAQQNVPGQRGSHTVYQLVRNNGPSAPIPWADGRVYDPNVDQTYRGAP